MKYVLLFTTLLLLSCEVVTKQDVEQQAAAEAAKQEAVESIKNDLIFIRSNAAEAKQDAMDYFNSIDKTYDDDSDKLVGIVDGMNKIERSLVDLERNLKLIE